jgi:hypothetical protein
VRWPSWSERSRAARKAQPWDESAGPFGDKRAVVAHAAGREITAARRRRRPTVATSKPSASGSHRAAPRPAAAVGLQLLTVGAPSTGLKFFRLGASSNAAGVIIDDQDGRSAVCSMFIPPRPRAARHG